MCMSLIFRQYKLTTGYINPLSANPTKWSKTLKQFAANLATNCLSMFDHFVVLALKGLSNIEAWNTLLVLLEYVNTVKY